MRMEILGEAGKDLLLSELACYKQVLASVLLQPILRNVSLKKSLKNSKEEQNDLWTVFW